MEQVADNQKILEAIHRIVTGLFVVIILTIFPLFYHHYYYDILSAKYYFYCISVGVLLVITICCVVYGFILKKYKIFENSKRVSIPEICMLAFIVVNILSTLHSDYKFESFWGNEGRYSGLFLWLFYAGSFFVVVRFFKIKKWYLDLFLVAAMLVCLLSIGDYFQLDLLDFKAGMAPSERYKFTATIGNINTFAAYVAMIIGVSVLLFAAETNALKSFFYYVCVLISCFAVIICNSDSIFLSVFFLFGVAPIFMFRNWKGIVRYVVVVATFFSVTQMIDIISRNFGDRVLRIDSLYGVIINAGFLPVLVFVCWLLAAMLYAFSLYRKKKEPGKWLCIAWGIFVGIILIVMIVAIVDINVLGNVIRYGSIGSYLHFDIYWGTNRGYIWKLAMDNFKQFSPMGKLLGFGPDTFGIMTVTNNYQEMMNFDGQLYDSVHNEYIQYLVTVGILGLLSYLGLIISSSVLMIKKGLKQPAVLAVFMGAACYWMQALVSISLPIVTPIMVLFVSIGVASARQQGGD